MIPDRGQIWQRVYGSGIKRRTISYRTMWPSDLQGWYFKERTWLPDASFVNWQFVGWDEKFCRENDIVIPGKKQLTRFQLIVRDNIRQ